MHDEPTFAQSDDVLWERLTALVAEGLPTDEERRLLAWVAESPERQAALAELRELWRLSGAARQTWHADEMIARLKTAAAERERIKPFLAQRRHPLRRVLAAAAIAGTLVGGWWLAGDRSHGVSFPGSPTGAREVTTARGQRLQLQLPDGTRVLLGPASRLWYANDYGTPLRTVELDGEGYFDVVHDDARPFAVRTPQAVVRDLGTRFTVRAREALTVDVAVVEGSVALSPVGDADAVVLRAGDVGVAGEGRAKARRNVALDAYTGWTEGRLVYDRVPLVAVAADLSRWFDADIQIAEPAVGQRLLTASFHEEPLTEVLEMIRTSFDLRLERSRDGRRFVLSTR